MPKIPPHQERILNIVFGCLLIFSLLLFAGIPALEQITKMDSSKQTGKVK
jgi:hypothetical protein